MIHDEAIKKLFFCCLNLFDYPFNGLQPRFGVCRTIRQNGASAMRPGEVHGDDVSRDEDVGVVVSYLGAFFPRNQGRRRSSSSSHLCVKYQDRMLIRQ